VLTYEYKVLSTFDSKVSAAVLQGSDARYRRSLRLQLDELEVPEKERFKKDLADQRKQLLAHGLLGFETKELWFDDDKQLKAHGGRCTDGDFRRSMPQTMVFQKHYDPTKLVVMTSVTRLDASMRFFFPAEVRVDANSVISVDHS
jgi:hypothetical protein